MLGMATKRRRRRPFKYAEVTDWLAANPGYHPPTEIAEGIGVSSTEAAHACIYLAGRKQIKRKRSRTVTNGPGSSTYSR